MRYLLDVNTLVALGVLQHEFHDRMARWVRDLTFNRSSELATSSITELGFIRVLVQAPHYALTVSQARSLLLQIKEAGLLEFALIADQHDVTHLPRWVKTAKQITDGHLVQLATENGAVFATLDRRIPGAFLVP